eukprot:3533817-Pleurochrysis_carterae.AAC.3
MNARRGVPGRCETSQAGGISRCAGERIRKVSMGLWRRLKTTGTSEESLDQLQSWLALSVRTDE